MNATAGRKGLFTLLLTLVFMGSMSLTASRAFAADEKIEDHMDAINDAYKKLKKQVGDAAQNKASAKLVAEMQKHALEAKLMTPERTGTESNKEQFLVAYQKSMNNLLIQFITLENAFLDGKNAEATELLSKINSLKTEEHKKFQVQE